MTFELRWSNPRQFSPRYFALARELWSSAFGRRKFSKFRGPQPRAEGLSFGVPSRGGKAACNQLDLHDNADFGWALWQHLNTKYTIFMYIYIYYIYRKIFQSHNVIKYCITVLILVEECRVWSSWFVNTKASYSPHCGTWRCPSVWGLFVFSVIEPDENMHEAKEKYERERERETKEMK